MQNLSTLLFWKTTILSSKLHSSMAAVICGEKTSRTSKRDSWSQLKCNLSNPVIWRSKGFPLSVSSLYRLCCGPAWASVCVYMFVFVCMCGCEVNTIYGVGLEIVVFLFHEDYSTVKAESLVKCQNKKSLIC